MERKQALLIIIVFSVIVLLGFVFVFSNVLFSWDEFDFSGDGIEERISSFESSFDSFFSSTSISLDLFSITQRVLLKHETRNFEVLRADDDQLYLGHQVWTSDEDVLEKVSEQISQIKDVVNSYGGHFLFCQIPYKSSELVEELSGYSNDITNTSEDVLCDILKKKNIEVLDLRGFSDCREYYKTDHHWSLFSAFNSSRHIVEELGKRFGFEFDPYVNDLDEFDSYVIKNSLLGSLGVKVGQYYVGKDDFVIYLPKFNTDLTLSHYINNGELNHFSEGSFWDAFISEEFLLDNSYFNKYNCLLCGADVEAVISNNSPTANSSALLISHSYGR